MKRTIQNLVQGSQAWHSYRATHFNASDAAAMLGISSYKSRDALLKQIATGIAPEIDSNTQRIFNAGHQLEEMARPIAVEMIGEDLYPITVSLEFDGLNLSASLDGITIDDSTAWEHKTLNANIEAALSNDEIPEQYRAQMEMQMLVSGATRCLFMASRGTADTEMHKWYESDPVMRARIIAGWQQFKIDLANYVAPEAEAPKPLGETIKELPALVVEITGEVKSSNLVLYKNNALDFIHNVNTDLQTDQDFATAENVVKFCGRVEDELKLVKKQILSQAVSVNEILNTIDFVDEEHRKVRLQLEKLIKSEKDSRKTEILNNAKQAWQEHVNTCNAALGSVRLPDIAVDFAGSMKNKRTIESLRSAVNDETARVKIEAARWSNHINANLNMLREIASDHTFLFPDRQQLVLKDKDALEAIAKQRIAEHTKAENDRIQAEAQKIADEQIAKEKAAREVEEKIKLDAEQAAIEAKRLEDERSAKALAAQQTKAIEPIADIPLIDEQKSSVEEYEQFAMFSEYHQNTLELLSHYEKVNAEVASVLGTPRPAAMGVCQNEEPAVLSEHQRGFLAGLELARKIALKAETQNLSAAVAIKSFIDAGGDSIPTNAEKAA